MDGWIWISFGGACVVELLFHVADHYSTHADHYLPITGAHLDGTPCFTYVHIGHIHSHSGI